MNAWILLAIAIGCEVLGTTFLKHSNGFAKWHWGMLAIASYSFSFWFLAPVLKVIPIGVAYAIWSGVGIVAITCIGFLIFEQKLSLVQFGFIGLITVSAIGLNLTTKLA